MQQEAFLIAQELAATRSLSVFVALRPSTFYISKTTGALSAYQTKILTISPPPADLVIEKRLTFALRIAEGKVEPPSFEGIRLNLHSIALFLRATLRSIHHNGAIRQFLGNVAGGNTRSVIELITTFCGSPNVDAGKIVDIEERTGNYVVPFHEFTKHALLGEYAYFNPLSSVVACNVYDVSAADAREHFLRSMIVAYLSSNLGQRDNDGFVQGEHIASEMGRHGFIDEQVFVALKALSVARLVETPHAHFKEMTVEDDRSIPALLFRATSIGIYHSRFWGGMFSFLDATSIDTPIFDEQARGLISSLAESFEIGNRLKRTLLFRDYLEERWHASNIEASYYSFPALCAEQQDSFDKVALAVEGLKNRPKRPASPRRAARARA